ncbi:MAG: hypothetical protein BWY68_00611 [bacterium ADurb.Bin400]|nr:MAG: hypothetical protein BWY68_00611 [bacterium ADurb.Bin400]
MKKFSIKKIKISKDPKEILRLKSVCLLVLLFAQFAVFPFFPSLTEAVYGSYPVWFPLLSIVAVAWGIPTVIGYLKKKRWGMNMAAATLPVAIFLMERVMPTTSTIRIIHYLVFLVIAAALILNYQESGKRIRFNKSILGFKRFVKLQSR